MLLREFIARVLLEGRVEDAQKRYPDVNVAELAADDPSGNHKYLMWMAKQVAAGASREDVVPTVAAFHREVKRFVPEKRDINVYRTAKELEDAVKDLAAAGGSKRKQARAVKAEGAPVVYEDRNVTVMRLDTKDSCIAYGRGTRWCISMEKERYYEQYKMSNVVFYLVVPKIEADREVMRSEKKAEPKDWEKVAFAYQRDADNQVMKLDIFLANDHEIDEQVFQLAYEPFALKVLSRTRDDAVKQPKGFLAKLRGGDYTPEEFLEYWQSLDRTGEYETDADHQMRSKMINRINVPTARLMGPVIAASGDVGHIRQFIDKLIEMKSVTESGEDPEIAQLGMPFINVSDGVLREKVMRLTGAYAKFINDPDDNVRMSLVRNAPLKTALVLNGDPSFEVMRMLIHRTFGTDLTGAGAEDVSVGIKQSVAQVAMRSKSKNIRATMARVSLKANPWMAKALAHLAKDSDSHVREMIAQNTTVDDSTKAKLLDDSDGEVQLSAAESINDTRLLEPFISAPHGSRAKIAMQRVPSDVADKYLTDFVKRVLDGQEIDWNYALDSMFQNLFSHSTPSVALDVLSNTLYERSPSFPRTLFVALIIAVLQDERVSAEFGAHFAPQLVGLADESASSIQKPPSGDGEDVNAANIRHSFWHAITAGRIAHTHNISVVFVPVLRYVKDGGGDPTEYVNQVFLGPGQHSSRMKGAIATALNAFNETN